jgi:hypothetical protein
MDIIPPGRSDGNARRANRLVDASRRLEARAAAHAAERAQQRRERQERDRLLGIVRPPPQRKPVRKIPASEVRPARIYTPVGVDFATLGFRPDEIEPARWLTHIARWKRLQWQADADGYVPLVARYLERIIGRASLARVRHLLHDGRLLHWDQHSQPGETAQRYRVREPYASGEWKLHLCRDDRLNARIARVFALGERPPAAVHKWLTSRFTSLEFDLRRALAIVRTLEPDEGSTLAPAEYRSILEGQCRGLADRVGEPSVCPFGRYHSWLTRLPKELRSCLSVAGEPLTELDVTCCQPLVLGLTCREFFKSGTARKRLLERSFDDGKCPYRFDRTDLQTPGPRDVPDVERFIELCEEGRLYESLQVRPGDPEDRARVKQQLFAEVLFCRNTVPYRRPLLDRFKALYPAVAAVLFELKKRHHARAAWVLQNLEARLVINRCCGRLMTEQPDTVLYTIHDSILCRRRDVASVRSVVENVFAEAGVSVRVREKEVC